MASLQGHTVKLTFKDILQVSNSNTGVDSSLRAVSDGEGTATPLELSTTQIRLNGQLWPSSVGNEAQVLTTHSDGTLYFADPSAGAVILNLNGLTDVTISGVASSNVLQYNGAEWVNLSLAGAGISAVGHTHTTANITDIATAAVAFTNKTGNVSQWTNDSGYATASSATAFTNKTGAISQWTNDSSYTTLTLVKADAKYVSTDNAVALSNKTGLISQWSNDSGYLTTNTSLAFKTIAVSGQSDVVADLLADTLTLVAGTNMTITTNAGSDTITFDASGGGGTPTAITIANEATDTTCFPAFFTAATGDLGPKTNASLTFNSNTATLACTTFSGALTGDVTGNVSGSSGSCTGNSATATLASTVTTNANLTGVITSVGNATSIASQTGTGTKFVVDTTPTLVTPVLGVATATSVNKVAITVPATSATLTIADGQTLTVNGSATITNGTHSGTNTGDQTNISGNAATVTVANEAADSTCFIGFLTAASGSLPLKTNTGLTYDATTSVLTATGFSGPLTGNVTGNVSGSSGSCTGNSATSSSTTGNAATVTTNANLTGPITSVGNATSIASQTGTGTKFVVDTTPTLVTPVLGVATATSINKLTLTQPATGSTLTIQDGFTLTASGNATVSGTHTGTSSGTNTGDQTTVSGNAGTATALATPRAIGGVNFDGTAAITPNNITAANDVTNATYYPTYFSSATGAVQPKTNVGFTVNPSTNTVTASTFVGALTGNVTGNTSGSSGSCTGNSATATLAATVTTNANLTGEVTSAGNAAVLDKTAVTNQILKTGLDTVNDLALIYDNTGTALKKAAIQEFVAIGLDYCMARNLFSG